MIDDYIYAAISNFKPGVRILSFSDSCHSGTVIKASMPKGISRIDKNKIKLPQYGNVNPVTSNIDKTHQSIIKYVPLNVLMETYKKNKDFYDLQKKNAPKIDSKKDVKSSAILISGCQDFQTSAAPYELENSLLLIFY